MRGHLVFCRFYVFSMSPPRIENRKNPIQKAGDTMHQSTLQNSMTTGSSGPSTQCPSQEKTVFEVPQRRPGPGKRRIYTL
ncbi:hypothetical protein B0H67DRAFT_578051 [Lasiosphaeris hirsuta]|uniref:Uncharacterized protein n=1 Tax=Lasiosphaeris hirsuta TaxID=260670 RepID=A0AA40DZ60_9PEZI|nr:hypothetical protein B0H67DRAFT_578051 [Lasiosphaeris hirsuta]